MIAGSFSRVPVRIASMRETSGMRSSSQLMAQRIAFRLAHHVVANSGAVRQKLIAQGLDEARITVVHNGLDLQRLATRTTRSESLSLLGLPAENGCRRSYVGIVANMRHDVKDYPMFLRAARRIKNEVQSAAFVMAGEGELMASLRTMARELDLQDSTFFLGRCERIAELISISDVCVLSSKAEGFSNAVLEYMAGARPVVATEVGGASEAIIEGETGYLVKSGDDAGMAERIISLLRDPQRAQSMGELGKQVVEEKFSCEAQLRRTEELYDRLLQERGPLRQNGV
jgi:glycosyltransferase involved in cell wall biosynthesis